jgi:SAM-dependent methyltransferase
VGCALGDILFRAERYGATKLLGIDMNSARLQVGKAIGSALTSSIEFRNDDFLNTQIDDGFDDVVLLNVIHHVSDVRNFLLKAAALAKQRLVVEYPTFHDPKFQSLGGCLPEGLSHLPIMGVSGSKVDQTFVFTSVAIERMVAEAGKFSATVLPSPISGREISIFSRVLGK